jgi:hypothetical protein
MRNHYSHERSVLLVRSFPVINDPKELHTILVFSLRHLWGDLESHSCDVVVRKRRNVPPEDATALLLAVHCQSESVQAVRAALTIVTTPPYLDDTLYRFDVVEVLPEENY